MHSLVSAGQEDAIAFYQKKGDSAGINVMFIHKQEDSWKAIGDFNNPASTVDKICFGDVNGDGHDEAVKMCIRDSGSVRADAHFPP